MEDGVKFIFKTLLKVPIIITVCYIIMNFFFFAFIYFKCLGISYVVMQTAVENNYIPNVELRMLCQYMNTLNDIPFISGNGLGVDYASADGKPQVGVVIAQDVNNVYTAFWNGAEIRYWRPGLESGGQGTTTVPSNIVDATLRRQYGASVNVGVVCNYHIIWPLRYDQTVAGGHVGGFNNLGGGGAAGGGITAQALNTGMANPLINTAGSGRGGGILGLNGVTGSNARYDLVMVYNVPGLHYYPDIVNY